MEEFLTTEEIAQNLKVNIITVRRWIHRGILPATKFLKEFRVSKKDFDKFVASRKVKK
jgi:excisionase family DNA binding protein